jgi:hypothetical protein
MKFKNLNEFNKAMDRLCDIGKPKRSSRNRRVPTCSGQSTASLTTDTKSEATGESSQEVTQG